MFAFLAFVPSLLKWLWSNKWVIPYLVIAVLCLAVHHEHAKLLASQAETKTTETALHTAVAANQSDTAAISELQSGLADLQKQLGQEQSDAAAAAAKASLASRALVQRLAAAQANLFSLEANPHDQTFLSIDISAEYPDIAEWLRSSDRTD